jgi:hypothetical protein
MEFQRKTAMSAVNDKSLSAVSLFATAQSMTTLSEMRWVMVMRGKTPVYAKLETALRI